MASEDTPQGNAAGRQPLPPAKRRQLQQLFERANRLMTQENWDYAAELFTTCVADDPGNFLYLQTFLANLKRKYNNNKKGSKAAFIKGAPVKRAVSKAAGRKDWNGVIKAGLEMLKLNPWHVPTLTAMAAAAGQMGFDEVELAYLKNALDAKPKDPDVNRLCAKALRERKLFDQAIACWHRVEQAKPGDEEAGREIARLAVEKTIDRGGYEDADRDKTKAASEGGAAVETSPEAKLERQIALHPEDTSNYLELADLHLREEAYEKAEKVLARAFEASDGDPDVRERWEDVQMRHLRQQIADVDREIEETQSEEAKQRRRQLRKKLNETELQVYEHRCERYPNNLTFKYDLGVRYQLAGRYNDAIAQFQQARNDTRRKGLCMLALGQCFQQIKQPRLAMTHYESAVDEIPDRTGDNRKLALYLAGKLAISLKDLEAAERHLTALAELDFAYRDVSTLLDKVARSRENEGEDQEENGG